MLGTIRLFFDIIATYNRYGYIDYQGALETEDGDNKFINPSISIQYYYWNSFFESHSMKYLLERKHDSHPMIIKDLKYNSLVN